MPIIQFLANRNRCRASLRNPSNATVRRAVPPSLLTVEPTARPTPSPTPTCDHLPSSFYSSMPPTTLSSLTVPFAAVRSGKQLVFLYSDSCTSELFANILCTFLGEQAAARVAGTDPRAPTRRTKTNSASKGNQHTLKKSNRAKVRHNVRAVMQPLRVEPKKTLMKSKQ